MEDYGFTDLIGFIEAVCIASVVGLHLLCAH